MYKYNTEVYMEKACGLHCTKINNIGVKIGKDVILKNVNIHIHCGELTVIIGRNGAGKSTTFKAILGLIYPESGEIRIFGKDRSGITTEDKEDIGTVLGGSGFSEYLTAKQIQKIMKDFYPKFRTEEFEKNCVRFKIPMDKKVKDFSSGMKAKLRVLLAVSHEAKLLILDEPTAGLDVTAREDILDLLREYVETPGRGILISSHISADLEQFCDDIYMIHQGKIVLHEETDRRLENYGVVKVSDADYEKLDRRAILRVKKENFGYSCLTDQRQFYLENYPDLAVEKGSVDEVISMMVRGEEL